jgi:nucleotide-binding universal stress UspA family protein
MEKIATLTRVALDNILYATDFSRASSAALPYALSIARKYGSRLFAVHVVSLSPFSHASPTMAWQALAGQAVREAKDAMATFEPRLENIVHEVMIRKGDMWKELSSILEEKRINLIVVGTHGRAGVSKALMGSVAEKILRQAPCPVLTVGPHVGAEPGAVANLHSILYATDFSPESLGAAPFAISLAQEHQARLYLLHVAEDKDNEASQSLMRTALRKLVPPHAEFSCDPKVVIEYGAPAQRILDVAEELAVDLIVLGVKRATVLPVVPTHFAMATAYKVVTGAICPVLTVRGG